MHHCFKPLEYRELLLGRGEIQQAIGSRGKGFQPVLRILQNEERSVFLDQYVDEDGRPAWRKVHHVAGSCGLRVLWTCQRSQLGKGSLDVRGTGLDQDMARASAGQSCPFKGRYREM